MNLKNVCSHESCNEQINKIEPNSGLCLLHHPKTGEYEDTINEAFDPFFVEYYLKQPKSFTIDGVVFPATSRQGLVDNVGTQAAKGSVYFNKCTFLHDQYKNAIDIRFQAERLLLTDCNSSSSVLYLTNYAGSISINRSTFKGLSVKLNSSNHRDKLKAQLEEEQSHGNPFILANVSISNTEIGDSFFIYGEAKNLYLNNCSVKGETKTLKTQLTNIEIKNSIFLKEFDLSVLSNSIDKHIISNCKFSNCQFDGKLVFKNTNFTDEFHILDTKFNNGLSVFNCDFPFDSQFPKAKDFNLKKQNYSFLKTEFRSLRVAAKSLNDSDSEHRFYMLEQKCRAKSGDLSFLERALSCFYRLFSNYGFSLSRPFLWLTGSMLLPSFVFYFLATQTYPDIFNVYWDCLKISLEHSLNPFKILSIKDTIAFNQLSDRDSKIITMIGMIQSLLIVSVAPLFLLSLRGKFSRALS